MLSPIPSPLAMSFSPPSPGMGPGHTSVEGSQGPTCPVGSPGALPQDRRPCRSRGSSLVPVFPASRVSPLARFLPLAAGLLLAGCGLSTERPSPPITHEPVRVLAPHWDQVCRDHREAIPFSGPQEVVRVEELQADLASDWSEREVGEEWTLRRSVTDSLVGGPASTSVTRPEAATARMDVAVSFERDGQVRSVHLVPVHAASLLSDSATAPTSPEVRRPPAMEAPATETRDTEVPPAEVPATEPPATEALPAKAPATETPTTDPAEAIRRHLRPQDRFLARTYVRLRLGGPPGYEVELLPALECLPHIQHEDHQPPTFLEGAQVQSGVPRMGDADERTVGVTLHLSAHGTLQEIEFVRGRENLLPRVKDALAETRFDPALMNGEPVPGSLTMTFRFP